MDGCALNVIEHVLLAATLISNAVTFGQAYVKSVEGQASGADCAGSWRGKTNSCPFSNPSSSSISGLSIPLVSQASPPSNQLDLLVFAPLARLHVRARNTTQPEPWYARWTYAAMRRFAFEPRDLAVGYRQCGG